MKIGETLDHRQGGKPENLKNHSRNKLRRCLRDAQTWEGLAHGRTVDSFLKDIGQMNDKLKVRDGRIVEQYQVDYKRLEAVARSGQPPNADQLAAAPTLEQW